MTVSFSTSGIFIACQIIRQFGRVPKVGVELSGCVVASWFIRSGVGPF